MKKYFFCLILLFAFKGTVKAQVIKPTKLNGFYKLYTKTYGKDSIFRGYFNFYGNNQYYFFGKTGYNAMGSGGLTISMFSKGKWDLDKSNIISIKDDKSTNAIIASNKPDSMNYQATIGEPFDTSFFSIQVFDDLGKPLPNELINFKSINRLIESDSVGLLKYSFAKSIRDSFEQVSFLGHEPFYPATIKINSDFNIHNIKVYLKRIPQNGYIQNKFYPLNLIDSLIRFDADSFKFKKSSLYKVNREEVLNYINEIQKSNLYFYKEFVQIKKLILK